MIKLFETENITVKATESFILDSWVGEEDLQFKMKRLQVRGNLELTFDGHRVYHNCIINADCSRLPSYTHTHTHTHTHTPYTYICVCMCIDVCTCVYVCVRIIRDFLTVMLTAAVTLYNHTNQRSDLHQESKGQCKLINDDFLVATAALFFFFYFL